MTATNQRLLSLDILRGLTIIFMIIVNDPGSWDHVYAPLLHADWNGITPTDYIFPTFIFIMGTSIVLALGKRKEAGAPKGQLLRKILWRALKIYLVGLFLWLFPLFEFDKIRWVGVLQRISVVYLACALIFLYMDYKKWIYLSVGILVAYLIIILYIPVPGIGTPDLSVPEKNWAHYLDSQLLPGVMWQGTWDPEGILSTFPSIVTGLLGMIAGAFMVRKNDLPLKMIHLFVFGFILLFLGDITSYIFPLNKNLWSSSFTLLVGGISALSFGTLVYVCDYKAWGSYFKFPQAFGVNAIFSYALAGMLTAIFYSGALWGGTGLNDLFVNGLGEIGFPKKLASLLYACIYVVIIWLPTSFLFRKKIYIKL